MDSHTKITYVVAADGREDVEIVETHGALEGVEKRSLGDALVAPHRDRVLRRLLRRHDEIEVLRNQHQMVHFCPHFLSIFKVSNSAIFSNFSVHLIFLSRIVHIYFFAAIKLS